METTSTTEPEIETEETQRTSFFENPAPYQLTIYLSFILIAFILISLVLQIILSKEDFEERSIREAKFNYNNDKYYRHPKY